MANKLQLLPVAVFVLFLTTFIVTYSIAVSYEHINPVFAYISDTGTLPPESCWFALLLSLTSAAIGAVVFVRYKQIQMYYRGKDRLWTNRLNVVAMVIGIISALGVMMVGAFQETNVILFHMIGAFMSFLGGSFYLTFQGYFTYKMLPMFTTKWLAIMRIVVGITCTILFIVTYACGVVSIAGFEGDNVLKWDKTEPKWTLRAVSVSCEWTMAALFDLYILSFIIDFRKISVKSPHLKPFEDY